MEQRGARRHAGRHAPQRPTVARGAFGNPWIFDQARALLAGRPLPEPPTVAEQGRAIREHIELCVTAHGPEKAARVARKYKRTGSATL